MPITYSLYNELSDIVLSARELPQWAHPEVHYWYPEWRKIRDCIAGERAVKEQKDLYLPQLSGQEVSEYASFIDRATFHNFTARTVNALGGSIMRRRPKVNNLPENRKWLLDNFTKDGAPFWNFASYIAHEVSSLGRIGVLVDLPDEASTQPQPYAVAYTAENILDWGVEMYEGRERLNYVVLREAKRIDPKATETDSSTFSRYAYAPRYRVLRFDDAGQYIQEIYENDDEPLTYSLEPKNLTATIIPQFRGAALDFIPFALIGPALSTASCEKPPMQDIASLNISHYRSYAYLEHGRFFTGFPIYWTELPMSGAEDGAEFKIGSSSVWMLPPGAKAGLLEMNGQGLKYLQDALDIKEAQAAQIGGRLMGVRGAAASMSDNQLTMQERNEQSVLLQITLSMDDRVSRIFQWMVLLSGVAKATAMKVSTEFNKDFLFNNTGARELRAIHSMFMDGVLPVQVFFEYMKKAEVIPDWMDQEEFEKFMADMANFPNNPDVEAKQEGFPDKKTQLEQENLEQERKDKEKARKEMLDRGVIPGQNGDAPDDEDDEDDNGTQTPQPQT